MLQRNPPAPPGASADDSEYGAGSPALSQSAPTARSQGSQCDQSSIAAIVRRRAGVPADTCRSRYRDPRAPRAIIEPQRIDKPVFTAQRNFDDGSRSMRVTPCACAYSAQIGGERMPRQSDSHRNKATASSADPASGCAKRPVPRGHRRDRICFNASRVSQPCRSLDPVVVKRHRVEFGAQRTEAMEIPLSRAAPVDECAPSLKVPARLADQVVFIDAEQAVQAMKTTAGRPR